MDPQHPQQNSGNFNQQQYDFITNPASKPKKSLFGLGGGNKMQRIAILLLIGFVLLTVLILAIALIFGGGSDARTELLRVAKQQNTILRLTSNALENSNNTSTRTLATTTEATMITDKGILVSQVAKSGKVKDEVIAGSINEETEKKLTNAAQNGQYDAVFEGILRTELETYQQQLQAANAASSGETTKNLLAQMFENSTTLSKFAQ